MKFDFKFKGSSKGIAGELIVGLMVIGVVTMTWIFASEIYVAHLFPISETTLAPYPNATGTLDTMKLVWDLWPLVIIFGVIVWIFARSQKREFDSGFDAPI